MKKYIFLPLILLMFIQSGYSQNRTFFGGEFALTGDVFEISDPCNLIRDYKGLGSLSWGGTIGQEIGKNWTIETGLIRKYYFLGYRYTSDYFVMGSNSYTFSTWQIPLRLKYRFNLINEKLFLTTTMGGHASINSGYGSSGSSYSMFRNESSFIQVNLEKRNSLAKTFFLVETGLGLDYMASNGFIFGLSSSYYTGLNKVYEFDVTTEDYNCNSDTGHGTGKGSYWGIAFGIKHDISSLWNGSSDDK